MRKICFIITLNLLFLLIFSPLKPVSAQIASSDLSSRQEDLIIFAVVDNNEPAINSPITISAILLNLIPINNVKVEANIPGNKTIELLDDGKHNDGGSGDDVYANIFPGFTRKGNYPIIVKVSGYDESGKQIIKESQISAYVQGDQVIFTPIHGIIFASLVTLTILIFALFIFRKNQRRKFIMGLIILNLIGTFFLTFYLTYLCLSQFSIISTSSSPLKGVCDSIGFFTWFIVCVSGLARGGQCNL